MAPAQERVELGLNLLAIADSDNDLSFEDVRSGRLDALALKPSRRPINLGCLSHPWWVRIELSNPTDTDFDRVLALRRGIKHAHDIWIESAGTMRQLRIGHDGTLSGDFDSRHAVVNVRLPAPETATITTTDPHVQTGLGRPQLG